MSYLLTALALLVQVVFLAVSLVGVYLTAWLGLYWIGPLTIVFWLGAAVFAVAGVMLARNIIWLVRS